MSGYRVPFDPALPVVVACQELVCGSQRFKRGDSFPWRDVGVSDLDLLTLWMAYQVDCLEPASDGLVPGGSFDVPPVSPEAMKLVEGALPGELVTVHPARPAKKQPRASR